MAIPTNYIDKITKDGESRDICPAANKVRVGNENFEGTDLNEVLNEIFAAIEQAASGGYAPPEGGIPATDLAQAVQDTLNDVANKVDKVTGKGLSTEDFTAALKAKLEALDPYTKAQVNTLIQQALSGIEGADVSVTTNQDGTFTIHVDETDYTINLNHTHENMAKIVKCTEATRPQTLANDTIYVQVDNLNAPNDIESLWLFGLEFTGGGAAPGVPMLDYPRVNELTLEGDTVVGATATIRIKAKNIAGSVNVAISGTDFSITEVDGTALQTPITSANSPLVISNADALTGVMLTIAYTGSTNGDEGGLVVSSAASQAEFQARSVDLVTVITEGIPQGWLANTAWISTNGAEHFTAPQQQEGYVTTEFFELTYDSSNKFDIAVKGGYLQSDLSGGCFVMKTNLSDESTFSAFLQSADPRRKTLANGDSLHNQKYVSATMKISELANCYIYDFKANNGTGAYLWAGSNVDTTVAPTVQPS